MATATAETQCVTCGKEKATSRCVGCSQDFCFNHLAEHRQQLNKQLDDIQIHRDLFLQIINEQTNDNPQKQLLIQQIAQWEQESIQKIKQTAEELRQIVSIHPGTNEDINSTKDKLNKLTEELRESQENDDIMESDLQKWNEELQQIKEQLNRQSTPNIIIRQSSTPLINRIQVEFSTLISIPVINTNAKWTPNGITVAGGNGHGNRVNQLDNPYAVYIDDDQTIYIADLLNHRIVEWKKGATIGQVVANGKGPGHRNDQFNSPTNVIVDRKNDSLIICDQGNRRVMRWPRRNGASGEIIIANISCWSSSMDNDGYLYVSDYQKHEVRRWKIGERNGTLVAGGNGSGNRFDQLNQPYNFFIDHDQSVYVSDCGNHRVMRWVQGAKEGIVVAGGQGPGNSLKQLCYPRGIVVDQLGTVYVADYNNHRVMRWLKGATEGSGVIGGNGHGGQANQFCNPVNLAFDRQNNLYVADLNNQRIQKFNIEVNSSS